MLFNSLPFMALLCVVLWLTFAIRRFGVNAAKGFMVIVSLAFYSLWNASDLPVLLLSLCVNWVFAFSLVQARGRQRDVVLAVSLVFNVLLLLYYKVAASLMIYASTWWPELPVLSERALPLGISFFTFQQIAYLVSIYRKGERVNGLDYSFVICFFPHLIAGPLVRHSDMARQLRQPRAFSFRAVNVFAGGSLFVIGLSKKVLLADPLGRYSHHLFASADAGHTLSTLDAWIAALSGFLNFYFDFSGYSDMACGIALMVGIRLPMNFYSPLKAVSMDEFWGRWNISVTQFIRDHVFRPLAGKRFVINRHLVALPITMIIAGFWHGSTFNFLLWGVLHGLLVTFQHGRRLILRTRAPRHLSRGRRLMSWGYTQLLLIFLGCVFQTHTLAGAWRTVVALVGFGAPGQSMPLVSNFSQTWWDAIALLSGIGPGAANTESIGRLEPLVFIAIAWGICLFAPNSIELLGRYRPVIDSTNLLHRGLVPKLPGTRLNGHLLATPSVGWGLFMAVLLLFTLVRVLANAPSPFNYYNY